MTELTLLERLNDDVPDPAPEVVLRSRRALLRAALEPRARRNGFRLLPSPYAGSPRWRVAVGGVAAALLAGGLLVVQAVESPSGASAQAAAALQSAARAAAEQPHVPPRPDQFMYVRTEASWSSTVSADLLPDGAVTYLEPQLYEAWISVDGAQQGLVRKTFEAPVFLSPEDEEALAAAGIGVPAAGRVDEIPLAPQPASEITSLPGSYAYLETLPTDADELFDLIRAQAQGKGQSLEQQMLDEVASLLRFTIAPPAVREALYEVASRINGVEIVEQTPDFSGRQGTTVAVSTNGLRWELIFDPDTAELLGTRTVVVVAQGGLPAGTVLGSDSTVVTVVDDVPSS